MATRPKRFNLRSVLFVKCFCHDVNLNIRQKEAHIEIQLSLNDRVNIHRPLNINVDT